MALSPFNSFPVASQADNDGVVVLVGILSILSQLPPSDIEGAVHSALEVVELSILSQLPQLPLRVVTIDENSLSILSQLPPRSKRAGVERRNYCLSILSQLPREAGRDIAA
jgi:hypothetical protein